MSSRRTAARLPRGRHPLTRRAVAASQRLRLLDAVARIVAHGGFGAATVAGVIRLGGVSRRTFYEQFEDLEACFLAAYADGMQSLSDAIDRALSGLPVDAVEARLRCAVETHLAALASRPDAARAFTIEVLAAGRKALERRAGVMARAAARWAELQAQAVASGVAPAPVDAQRWLALVGAADELVRETLRCAGASALPGLAEALCELVFALFGIVRR